MVVSKQTKEVFMRVPTWKAIPEWADHMTKAEFIEAVDSGCFTQSDGMGYLATATSMCENTDAFDILFDAPEMYTHVVWYNK
jgi:hypothetical protein